MSIRNGYCAALAFTWACIVPASGALAASGDVPVAQGQDWPVKPPLPIWPSDLETITDRRPVFRLNGRFQATRYRLELSRDPDFTDPITITQTRTADNGGIITPVVLAPYNGNPLADGQYYWRAFCGNDEGLWTPAANYRTFFVADEDYDEIASPSEPTHPRLLLTAEDLAGLRARTTRSDHLRRGWQYQVNAAFSALDLAPPDEAYAKAGKGQHGSYSTAAGWYHRHLENVAFVAFVTRNHRLAEKGVQMLMTACSYQRWLGPLFDRPEHFDPPWNSALETAMMTEAVAIGYDLLYHHLTDAQRETVRQALADKGIRMLVHDWADPVGSSQIPRHQLPTGNWVMVCTCSAGIGALAILGEHPDAARWSRLVRNRTRAWLNDRGGDWFVDNPYSHHRPDPIPVIGPSEPNFGIDGGYKESIAYMNYAMRYVCFFADALHETTGESLFGHVPDKLLDPMAWSIMAYPIDGGLRSAIVDFGDCGAATSWYHDLLAALVKNRGDRRASWLYRRTVPVAITPRSLLWFDDAVVDSGPDTAVPMGVFHGIGQVIMRSGFSPETPMAAIKFRQNRGHLDIGTFYLFGAGHPTIIDSGVTSYGSRIYRDYSSKSIAHNLVLVDDRAQVRANGTMLAAVGTSRMTAASGQLSPAYPEVLESWTRDLLMLPDGVTLVHDRLEGKGPHQFDLILHPQNPFTLTSPGELVVGEKPGETFISVHSDGAFTATEQDGYYATLPRKYVRFNADAPEEGRSFLTLCRWPTGRLQKPISPVIEPTGPGQWRIDATRGSSRLSVRTGEAGGASDDRLVSDARLAAVWDPRQRTKHPHAIVLAGKRLSVDGRERLHATEPVNGAIEFGLPLRAHFWAAKPARVTLAVDEQVRDVYLDGSPITARWHHGAVTIDIPAGESRLLASEFDRPFRRLPPLAVADLPPVTVPDEPAYQPDVYTRASTSWTDGMDAIDGDPNTMWISMPGVDMPQWLEVRLPRPESMTRMEIGTGLPCAGRLETWNPATQSFKLIDHFETSPDEPSCTIQFDSVTASRIRAVIERIHPSNNVATIHSLSWIAPGSQQARPTSYRCP